MNMFKKNEKTIIIDCTINVKLPKKMINPVTIDEAMNNQNIHHLITEAKNIIAQIKQLTTLKYAVRVLLKKLIKIT